jgi:hypothetical protein
MVATFIVELSPLLLNWAASVMEAALLFKGDSGLLPVSKTPS